ncbi:hypothetical protein ACJX0J_035963, partial [Zea mays]
VLFMIYKNCINIKLQLDIHMIFFSACECLSHNSYDIINPYLFDMLTFQLGMWCSDLIVDLYNFFGGKFRLVFDHDHVPLEIPENTKFHQKYEPSLGTECACLAT